MAKHKAQYTHNNKTGCLRMLDSASFWRRMEQDDRRMGRPLITDEFNNIEEHRKAVEVARILAHRPWEMAPSVSCSCGAIHPINVAQGKGKA